MISKAMPCQLWSFVVFLAFFSFFEILWDPLRSFEILWDPLRSFEILWDPVKVELDLDCETWVPFRTPFELLWTPLRSCEILWDPVRSNEIFWDPLRSCQGEIRLRLWNLSPLELFLRFFELLWVPLRSFEILWDPYEVFLRSFWDPLTFLSNFEEFSIPTGDRICCG